jgi:hypothetical protein
MVNGHVFLVYQDISICQQTVNRRVLTLRTCRRLHFCGLFWAAEGGGGEDPSYFSN